MVAHPHGTLDRAEGRAETERDIQPHRQPQRRFEGAQRLRDGRDLGDRLGGLEQVEADSDEQEHHGHGPDESAGARMLAGEVHTAPLRRPGVGDEPRLGPVVRDEVAAAQARFTPADLDAPAGDGEARRDLRLGRADPVAVQPRADHARLGVTAVLDLHRVRRGEPAAHRQREREQRAPGQLPPAEGLERLAVSGPHASLKPSLVPARPHDYASLSATSTVCYSDLATQANTPY